MARWLALAVGASAIALPVGVGLLLARRAPGDASPELRPGDDDEEVMEPVSAPAPNIRRMLRNRSRLGGRLDPRLEAFLDWWDRSGPFLITVGLDGGLRSDPALQEDLWKRKKSNARYLWQTPHGRGGAVDLWVYKAGTLQPAFDTKDPATLAKYEAIGAAGKAHGLVWGGDWTTLRDYPHLEVPDWQRLPFPPRFAA